MSVNKVLIIGNIGKDAETRKVGEKFVIKFAVATTDSYKNKEGNVVDETEWHDCEYWRDSDKVAQYLVKGAQVYIEGSIKTDTYEVDGQKRFSKKIRVKDLRLLGNKLHTQPQNDASPSAPGEPLDDMPF